MNRQKPINKKNYLNTARIAKARKVLNVDTVEELMKRETFYRIGQYVMQTAIYEKLIDNKEVPSSFIITLSQVEFKLNGRLTKTLGRYQYYARDGKILPVNIELSKKLATYGTFDEVMSTALHEMAHLVLSLFRKDGRFHDGDEPFEYLLKVLGASSTRVQAIDFPKHSYKCKCNVHTMARRARTVKYSCRSCEATLEYIGELTESERKKVHQSMRTI